MASQAIIAPDKFSTFGELLKFLRRRAGLTQRELSIAVGYSEGQISRLEKNQRLPDLATLSARFVPALYVADEPPLVARLLELAADLQRDETAQTGTRASRAFARNLPLQLTSFIGRAKEIVQVKSLLAAGRLVTLTGPGGVGKTRLSLQVAAEVLSDYPDGVWRVELAAISNPTFVPLAVGSALDLREEASFHTLADYLRPKSLLLILDNCEHIITACAKLAEALLQTCPELMIMTTTREGLGIAGEAVFLVPSLSVPERGQAPTLAALGESEAVQLFVDRAKAALGAPGFALTDEDAPALAQLCYRLDGIPLAIELAAARVTTLSIQQIAARLDNRFRLLTGGSRTAVPRHQTLSALIGWSYEQLSEAERTLLRRLSVFSGGWTLEAAEAICADDMESPTRQPDEVASRIDSADVLELLAQLVHKSLIVAEREAGHEVRYDMLETIQQYASERLLETGEGEQARNRHLRFFTEWAETAAPEVRGRDQLDWFGTIETEHDNLRMALEWSLESGSANADLGLRIAAALAWFWYVRGYWGEGRAWLERLLAAGGASQPIRNRAVGELFQLTFCAGDNVEASALLEEHFATSRESGDKTALALALVNQAEYLNWMQQDFSQSEALLRQGLALYRELGPAGRWGYGRGLIFQGEAAFFQADYPRAESLFKEALASFRKLGDRYGIAYSLELLGMVAWRRGDRARAQQLLEDSVTVNRELGVKVGVIKTLNRLGRFKGEALQRGDHQAVESQLKESLALARDVQFRWGIQQSLWGLAESAARRGQLEREARLLGAVEAVRDTHDYSMLSSEQADFDDAVAASRARLDEKTFAAAWAEGRAMTLEQAIAYGSEAA